MRKFNAGVLITRVDATRDGHYAEGVILLETARERKAVRQLVRTYFEQNSFSGYLLPGAGVPMWKLLNGIGGSPWWEPRASLIKGGGAYFEDWDDGCGLKVWIRTSDRTQLPKLVV